MHAYAYSENMRIKQHTDQNANGLCESILHESMTINRDFLNN